MVYGFSEHRIENGWRASIMFIAGELMAVEAHRVLESWV